MQGIGLLRVLGSALLQLLQICEVFGINPLKGAELGAD